MMRTLEEVSRICDLSRLLGPTVFVWRDYYATTLHELTGLTKVDYRQCLICTDGPTPMLPLEYFDQVAQKHAELSDDLWL